MFHREFTLDVLDNRQYAKRGNQEFLSATFHVEVNPMKYHAAAMLRATLKTLTATLLLMTANAFASQFTLLHSFHGRPAANPDSELIAGPDGGFYGTSGFPNTSGCPPKLCGTVFEIKHTSSGWRFQVIHNFRGPQGDGESPAGSLIFDKAGNLYGTTFSQGSSACLTQHTDCGTVFKLSRTSKGGWAEKVLYRFTGNNDGAFPGGNLALDAAGNLYGDTLGGGSFIGNTCSTFGCGVVYELSPGSSAWTETVLYTFTGGSDGWEPEWLTSDNNGNFLGVARFGGTVNSTCGSNGCGTVFRLAPGAGGWTQSVLYSFSGGSDGGYPSSKLIFDSRGNVYGTAAGGGSSACSGGCGIIFELSQNGSGWNFKDLYSFSGTDGEFPNGILFDPAGNISGNILGVAAGGIHSCPGAGCGVLFKLVPGFGNWTETVLFEFNGTSNGYFPNPVTMDGAGNLFGTAVGGGSDGFGTLFEFTP
jgi:uncharacterized repeat protein (TIGR03803 family)